MAFGKTVKLFLADGTATGIRHVEITNWTGQAIAAPRTRYSELKEWEELQRPGVYFLFGYSDTNGAQMTYIGESENVWIRLGDHVKKKDFWGECVAFTSKDLNLTKAHVKWLESRLIGIAEVSGRFEIDNRDRPLPSSLPRSDVASMEEYVELVRITLSALGYPVLDQLVPRVGGPAEDGKVSTPLSSAIRFSFSGRKFSAEGIRGDEGFIVFAGSCVSEEEAPSTPKHIRLLRERALEDGSLLKDGESLKLTADVLFTSPSAAASFVSGSSRSGKDEWKDAHGKSIGDIESEQADSAEASVELEAHSDINDAVQHSHSPEPPTDES